MAEQGKCPKCGSLNLNYDIAQFCDEGLYYPITCNDCSFTGQEHYDLQFACILDKDKNEID